MISTIEINILTIKGYIKHKFLKIVVLINALVYLLPFCWGCQLYAQESFRRHFIIAYDISNEFITLERSNISYQRAIEDLFQNRAVVNYQNGSTDEIFVENQAGITFFEPDRDEISFFHFNIPSTLISSLRDDIIAKPSEISNHFSNAFILNTNRTWTSYKEGRDNPSIIGYFYNVFNIPNTPALNSQPNIVYPLILGKIGNGKPSEEYILIILTQNIPELYSVRDVNTIKEELSKFIMPVSSVDELVSSLATYMDNLQLKFNKNNYFNYSFNTNNVNIQNIGIYGYKLSPKSIVTVKPSDLIKVIPDIRLTQSRYKAPAFSLSSVKVSFPQGIILVPSEITLKVTLVKGSNQSLIFEDIIAQEDNGWTSNYSPSNKVVTYKRSKSTYKIHGLKIPLDDLNSVSNLDGLKYNFEIKAQTDDIPNKPISFIYHSEVFSSKQKIDFLEFKEVLLYRRILPGLIIVLLVIFITIYGRPRKINFHIHRHLDSILKIDYNKFGQRLTPYKFWNDKEDQILVEVDLQYYTQIYPFNWNASILLTIEDQEVPSGFSIFLKPDQNTIAEYTKGSTMSLKIKGANISKFFVVIRQHDLNIKINELRFIRFRIHALVRESRLFLITSEVTNTLEYKLHIGGELGDTWVGLDPGTSGSCITVGNQSDNIIFGRSAYGSASSIIPSKIIFNTDTDLIKTNNEIPDNTYKYGILANSSWDVAKVKFQSFKKLLGYKDIKEIKFANKEKLELTGKDLSSLLIKGLYKELEHYLKESTEIDFLKAYNGEYAFNPHRAVIAIPNNSTISKIQDIINCVNSLNKFQDIRYIYEAEAALFYYLGNYNRFNADDKEFSDEVILVFDMGGATINATIVKATKKTDSHKIELIIDFLGKIGYAIGGDTIDYCLIQFLLSFSKDFPELKFINIDNQRDQLASLAQSIKEEISYNYHRNFDYLITFKNLQTYINRQLKLNLSINESSNIYKFFIKDSNGSFNLFTHPLFIDVIYRNVKDAITEVLGLSNNIRIDKVIFSGRSTYFPLIYESVESRLAENNNFPEIIKLDLEESKTAVAYGACWYGINKNSIILNNLKTYASFGVKRTIGPSMTNIEYFELLKYGNFYKSRNDRIGSVRKEIELTDEFPLDGAKVNFYQVMGKDASMILSNNQKHKYAKIASINIPMKTRKIAITVMENDEINCDVELITNKRIREKGVVSDQEITEANEKHYTWIIS